MLRTQDILFALLCLVLASLLALHIGIVIAALVGSFACGSLYIFAGMLPSTSESLGQRLFVSVFLAIVLSSLILILPGTFGGSALRHDVQHTVAVIAAMPPLIAVGFEVFRTPRIVRGIRHWLGHD